MTVGITFITGITYLITKVCNFMTVGIVFITDITKFITKVCKFVTSIHDCMTINTLS